MLKISKLIFFLSIIITINSLLQSCPSSYFFDIQHCEKCQSNCICRAQNTCDSCIDGYTMYKNKCIICPQATPNIYGQCSGCCSRQTGTQLACTDCTPVVGKYSFLFSGRCILSDGCFQVDSNGFCTQCRTGYYETNNLCHPCDSSCATCTDVSNCLTCAPGYYWKVNHGGLCTGCPSGCATCDTLGVCYSCLTAYYKYTDHCLQCPADCLTCIDGSTCSSCSAGILVSNLCIRCTDTTYGGSAGCLSCSQNNNFIKCQQCDDTYFLDSSTGVCRLCSTYISGAIRCRDSNTPTQCASDSVLPLSSRYYLVGISCVQNTKNCKKSADVLGNCASCYDLYIYNNVTKACDQCIYTGCKVANQTVVSNVCTCTQCDLGYFLPAASVVCSPCSGVLNCATCTTSSVCTSCMSGFYLANPTTCTSAVVANCAKYASASTCSICNDNYYLGSDNLCYSCQTNCLKCTNRFTCSSCNAGYILHSSNICVQIPSYCIQYDATNFVCTLCQHGYYLSNGFCNQCSVQKGTLSQCQGLCPIDYYIKGLLTIKKSGAVHFILPILSIFLVLVSWI